MPYYIMVHYTTLFQSIHHLFVACFHHAGFHRLPDSLSLPPLPSLNFSRSLFLLSKRTLLLEHVPSSFSFFPVLTADRTSTYLSILSGFQTSLATSCIFKFTFSSFSFCVYFPLARLATRRAKQISPCGFLIIEIE